MTGLTLIGKMPKKWLLLVEEVVIVIVLSPGYGHISPTKVSGQLACMFYLLFGLPIMMIFLANIGGAMADGLRYAYRFGLFHL